MKKTILSLTMLFLAGMLFAQQMSYSPNEMGSPMQNGENGDALMLACDNEKGYYDFPFTENGITVTGSGSGSYTFYGPGWGSCGIFAAANCVWIGSGGPGTFVNTFSSPVNNMIYNLTATDIGEVITINVDAGTPTITLTDGSCPTWFSIVGNVLTCIDGSYPAAGARILITSTSDFSSIEFSHNGLMNGTTMTMCFDQVLNPPADIPLSNWAILIGGLLMVLFVFIRFRK